MNGLTILLWITIFIIGLIAIIAVKLRYKGEELEKDEDPIISSGTLGRLASYSQETISNSNNPQTYTPQSYISYDYPIEEVVEEKYNIYEAPKAEEYSYDKIEYESQNQVLINYKNEVEKFQEPMTQSQVEIMTQDNEKHELKDLFTIDELIKESKRKDSEREKESQQINKSEDEDLTEIKESIKRRQENDEIEESLIEEILADEEIGEILRMDNTPEEDVEQTSTEPTIQDIIDESEAKVEETVTGVTAAATIENIIKETPAEETVEEPTIENVIKETPAEETVEEPTIKNVIKETPAEETVEEEKITPTEIEAPSQKDIAEVIDNASQEIEEKEIESISESDNITDVLLNSEQETEEEIFKEPVLKSPTKIDETKTEEFSAPIDDSNLNEPQIDNDLDYRKDLARITNTIKGSKLFQDVKDRLKGEPEEEIDPIEDLQSSYIRNVNEYEEEYDEYAPIINETHDDFGEVYEPDYDQVIREENTRKLMNNVRTTPEPEIAKPKIEVIKSKPSRDNIKIQIGNTDAVLKKGDEIIFKHDGETYSSQVYAINGDDISVRYRRKDIIIKPEDVKKIY